MDVCVYKQVVAKFYRQIQKNDNRLQEDEKKLEHDVTFNVTKTTLMKITYINVDRTESLIKRVDKEMRELGVDKHYGGKEENVR